MVLLSEASSTVFSGIDGTREGAVTDGAAGAMGGASSTDGVGVTVAAAVGEDVCFISEVKEADATSDAVFSDFSLAFDVALAGPVSDSASMYPISARKFRNICRLVEVPPVNDFLRLCSARIGLLGMTNPVGKVSYFLRLDLRVRDLEEAEPGDSAKGDGAPPARRVFLSACGSVAAVFLAGGERASVAAGAEAMEGAAEGAAEGVVAVPPLALPLA